MNKRTLLNNVMKKETNMENYTKVKQNKDGWMDGRLDVKEEKWTSSLPFSLFLSLSSFPRHSAFALHRNLLSFTELQPQTFPFSSTKNHPNLTNPESPQKNLNAFHSNHSP